MERPHPALTYADSGIAESPFDLFGRRAWVLTLVFFASTVITENLATYALITYGKNHSSLGLIRTDLKFLSLRLGIECLRAAVAAGVFLVAVITIPRRRCAKLCMSTLVTVIVAAISDCALRGWIEIQWFDGDLQISVVLAWPIARIVARRIPCLHSRFGSAVVYEQKQTGI